MNETCGKLCIHMGTENCINKIRKILQFDTSILFEYNYGDKYYVHKLMGVYMLHSKLSKQHIRAKELSLFFTHN